MSSRLVATAVATVLVAALAGCAKDEPATPADPTTATPSATVPSDDPRAALVGSWRADDADWTVHFAEDGTYTEDFEGNVDFRRGAYRVEDGIVFLDGDDGETTEGEISGETLNFKLGMLERL
ncbi:hypothetical protein AFL01nite_24460 [Aeromicrobium flavum]|uniref:Lipoprotein n=1 Tax=Aeromicrobium flavum TaxID=416568 RepID=A0A512HXE3_9ACTN|nr:hypothetical protein [Aeromicrobium flavum]GEO90119.1 hypothetical protein AFL01nite_24460 [Aeromicrobium flavum]